MPQYGFIHDKLDVKLLVLYILSRAAGSLDLDTLLDLTMVDDGVDYFTFMEVLSELENTGHLTMEDNRYAATDKGRRNSAVCESSLPYSVRRRAMRKLTGVNAALRRNAQVRAEILPRTEAGCTLRLTLDDDQANLLTIELFSPSEVQAGLLAESFKSHPEQIYNGVLDLLIDQGGKEGEP